MAAKRDFGSFHSSNVQELLAIETEKYKHPQPPFEEVSFDKSSLKFGLDAKRNYFYLEEECIFLNHGAFGAVLKPSLECAQQWQKYIERQPLRFFDRELLPYLVSVTRRFSKFVNCDAEDFILVPNVTTAVNCVMRSQELKPGDTIYALSVEYGAVKKIIRKVCQEFGAKVQEETVTFPIADVSQICELVEQTLIPGTKLAVFDHIPSNTPYVLPVKEICAVCHSKNVPVLIDGAHALGQLDLDISSLGVDYYVSNAHKWLCAPKGCAFMYVRKELQSTTKPLIVSHGVDSGFNSKFIWAGLRDYSPWLALRTVLDFWEGMGPDTLRSYMHTLARQAGDLLVERWNSGLLVTKTATASMLCVQLPADLYEGLELVDYAKAEAVQNALYHQYNIEVPVKAVQGSLYVRISAHIHNHYEEYDKLASAVLELVRQGILKNKVT